MGDTRIVATSFEHAFTQPCSVIGRPGIDAGARRLQGPLALGYDVLYLWVVVPSVLELNRLSMVILKVVQIFGAEKGIDLKFPGFEAGALAQGLDECWHGGESVGVNWS